MARPIFTQAVTTGRGCRKRGLFARVLQTSAAFSDRNAYRAATNACDSAIGSWEKVTAELEYRRVLPQDVRPYGRRSRALRPHMDHANTDKRSDMKNYRPTRPQHRSRSHDDAHSAEDAHDPGESRANPLVYRGEAKLVTTHRGLTELIERLRAERTFAYDSEFIGELSYLPKLCVIQTATPKEISLIDPLAGEIDLRPFWELVADGSVEKVTHAGQQDLEPVIRHLGRPAQNIFDTQIASGFAGMAYPVSLSKLVREIVGAKLGKGLTFTHWDQRPLSNQQLKYAANDVRYLPAVRLELGRRLEAVGHMQWAMAECAAQCDVGLYRFDPETAYLKVRGAGSLGPQGLAVLKELVIWRDSAARQHDVPPRAFLKDEILIDMSREPIKSVEKLARVRGLPRPVEQAHGAETVQATRRWLAAPPGAVHGQN